MNRKNSHMIVNIEVFRERILESKSRWAKEKLCKTICGASPAKTLAWLKKLQEQGQEVFTLSNCDNHDEKGYCLGHKVLLNEEFKKAIQEVVDKFKEEYDCDLVAVCAFSLKDEEDQYTQAFEVETASNKKVLYTLSVGADVRLRNWSPYGDALELEVKKYEDRII